VSGELDGESLVQRVNVADAGQVESLVGCAVSAWGGLDARVNNAGVGIAATTPDTEMEDYYRVTGVCVRGTFLGM
jgi:NAD(P)-dependent dehydrogenase (short-subunit alcohol dehydrogenase family)